jgi:hypothetical protein
MNVFSVQAGANGKLTLKRRAGLSQYPVKIERILL